MSSDDRGEVTPVPMPNTEVKLSSADDSWGFPPVKVGRRWAIMKRHSLWRMSFFVVLKGCAAIILEVGATVVAPTSDTGRNQERKLSLK